MIVLGDLKYAFRLLLKKPGFTILTTFVMATGIGLSLYLFSFLNTMMFKPLPFEDGETLIQLSSSKNGSKNNGQIDIHDFLEVRTNIKGLAEFGAFNSVSLNVSGKDGSRRYNAIEAEANIFRITRTKPILGREFSPLEDKKGAEQVTVIGYDMWQNQFSGKSDVIDQSIRVNGISYRIIGVMPLGYSFPSNAEMWIPLQQDATKLERGKGKSIYGIAHLKGEVSMEDINQQLAVIMKRVEHKYPKTNSGVGAYIETIQKASLGRGIVVVYSMQIVAILILLLASINVGNLLLSRAVERGKETAIRVALGAPRSRLISQMLWESIIICCAGGIIGLAILSWGFSVTETVTATFFDDGPRFWWKFGIDGYTLKLFSFFILGTVLITGLLPAWKNSGADFISVLRDGTRGALGKKAGRLNRILVISEIFISITVLIAAAVMMIGTYKATHADYGANTENILMAKVRLNDVKYNSANSKIEFIQSLQLKLENSNEISNAMMLSALPGEFSLEPKIALEGKEYIGDGNNAFPQANYIVVAPGSLANLGIDLKDGRYFDSRDEGLGKNSIVVTESFVSRHFPNESPLGKRVRIVESEKNELNWLTIVGVVEHTIQGLAHRDTRDDPSIFRPFSQAPRNQMTIAMQMKSSRENVTRALRSTLGSIDTELPAYRIEPYTDFLARNSAPLRFISIVFILFGLAALVLAASGIYGVMSNTINQRAQEIGVKRALGALEARITKEFLRKGFKQLLIGGIPGLLVGSAMGFGMSKIMGLGVSDLVIIATIMIFTIGSVVMFSTYLPTKKVLEMEPIDALRND